MRECPPPDIPRRGAACLKEAARACHFMNFDGGKPPGSACRAGHRGLAEATRQNLQKVSRKIHARNTGCAAGVLYYAGPRQGTKRETYNVRVPAEPLRRSAPASKVFPRRKPPPISVRRRPGRLLMPPAPSIDPATLAALEDALGKNRLRRDVVLAPYTTFKIGGPADFFFEARTADELAEAVLAARRLEVHHFLLGVGANILVGDGGFRGLVIRNAADHARVRPDRHQVWAESGAIVYPDVIEMAVSAGLSGLEHYVGIPSTVGGALWQNLHFLAPPPLRERTMFIEEVLLEADLLTQENERRTVGVAYFEFGYDASILHTRDDVVLTATFQLAPGDEARMREIMAANLAWRAERHPPLDTEPSVGSIFKKIDGIGAGRLIDQCGLKGACIGGVVVTHRHANIMINRGGARAADVRALIDYVQQVVERETGYRLETEIAFIGAFDPPTPAEPVFLPRPPGLVTAEERAAQRAAEEQAARRGAA